MKSNRQALPAHALVRRGAFARLWWASVVGSTGDWMTVFATIALGNAIGGETGVLVALVSRILPGLVLGAAVGVISDRVDRRRLVVISDVGRGLLVPMLVFADNLPFLVAVNVGLEIFSLVGQAPRNAMMPRLVREENLVTANSLILGATYGTIPIGAGMLFVVSALPALTFGGIITGIGAEFTAAFLLDALTFFVSAALIASLPELKARHAAERPKTKTEPTALGDLIDGAKFFWQRRSVRRVIVGMTAALVGGGSLVVLGNSFVEDVLQADQTGFFALITSVGAGAALGIALVSLYEARLMRRDLVFAFSLMATGLGLAAASVTATVAGAASWVFLMGLGAGAAYVMGLTHLHEEVDDELRGRVFATLFGLMRIGLFASMAIAAPLVGVVSGIGIGRLSDPRRFVLFLGGLVIIASGISVLWSLRALFEPPKLGAASREILARAGEARRAQLGRQRRATATKHDDSSTATPDADAGEGG